MSPARVITIVGGGLAGLSLGIALRRRGVDVALRESGRYPRHRVCGEFISGRGQEMLARLGVTDRLLRAGAVTARTAALFCDGRRIACWPLPRPALCLSRFELDAVLAAVFLESGGALDCETRGERDSASEGTVVACGRRPPSGASGTRWFGLKAHATRINLEADLEMHVMAASYVGMCRLRGGTVNVCGLFKAATGEAPGTILERLKSVGDPRLGERLEAAKWDPDSTCAVAGLPLDAGQITDSPSIRIGDARAFIAPVTGNGMSMAFESAEMAVEPLAAYARGAATWADTMTGISGAWEARFRRRLTWAARLQRWMFHPLSRRVLRYAAGRRWVRDFLFAATRD